MDTQFTSVKELSTDQLSHLRKLIAQERKARYTAERKERISKQAAARASMAQVGRMYRVVSGPKSLVGKVGSVIQAFPTRTMLVIAGKCRYLKNADLTACS